MVIGLVSIGISLLIGGTLGIIAAYYSNSKFVFMIIWVTDILMSFPTIILGAIVGIMFGPGLVNTIIAIAIAFIPRFIRLTRGNTLSAKEDVYITAAKSLGMSDWRIITIHLLPNIISSVIVMAVIWTSAAITIEVALSFFWGWGSNRLFQAGGLLFKIILGYSLCNRQRLFGPALRWPGLCSR